MRDNHSSPKLHRVTRICHITALVALLLAAARQTAQAAQELGRQQPTLHGFWECIDTRTRGTTRKIQFNFDGSYQQWNLPGGSRAVAALVTGGKFEVNDGSITLYVVPSQGGRILPARYVLEHGRVRWIDSGLFEMQVDDGRSKFLFRRSEGGSQASQRVKMPPVTWSEDGA